MKREDTYCELSGAMQILVKIEFLVYFLNLTVSGR